MRMGLGLGIIGFRDYRFYGLGLQGLVFLPRRNNSSSFATVPKVHQSAKDHSRQDQLDPDHRRLRHWYDQE